MPFEAVAARAPAGANRKKVFMLLHEGMPNMKHTFEPDGEYSPFGFFARAAAMACLGKCVALLFFAIKQQGSSGSGMLWRDGEGRFRWARLPTSGGFSRQNDIVCGARVGRADLWSERRG